MVEDDDNKEGNERFVDSESQTDDNTGRISQHMPDARALEGNSRVKNDTKFQNCNGDKLRSSLSLARNLVHSRDIRGRLHILALLSRRCAMMSMRIRGDVGVVGMNVMVGGRGSDIHAKRRFVAVGVSVSISLVVSVGALRKMSAKVGFARTQRTLTVVDAQSLKSPCTRSISGDFSKEDEIDSSHNNGRCPILF